MSSTYESNKSPEELEREVEQVRAEVRTTLDDLRDSLSPGQMLDQALEYVRGSGGADFTRNLGRTVRDNPMPIALIGAGIGWLVMSDRLGWGNGKVHADRRHPRYTADELYTDPDTHHTHVEGSEASRLRARASGAASRAGSSMAAAGEAARERAGSMAASAEGAAHRAGDAAYRAGESAREHAGSMAASARDSADQVRGGARRMMHDARERVADAASAAADYVSSAAGYASSAGDRVRHTGEHVRGGMRQAGGRMRHTGERVRDASWDAGRQVTRVVEEQPLILGAVGFVVGAVIGAALPASSTEDRLFGSTADRVKRGARSMAREGMSEAADVATEAVHEAGRALDERGLSGRGLKETIGAVGDSVKEAVSTAGDRVKEDVESMPRKSEGNGGTTSTVGSTTGETGRSGPEVSRH